MKKILKQAASLVSPSRQQQLKRLYFARQLRAGRFVTDEPEFSHLGEWVQEGDCVLDIGANIGHYTCRLSQLVGQTGRVISVEPVPETFELLASNVCALPLRNVTLLNIAASEDSGVLGMSIPAFDTGLKNYYRASLTDAQSNLQVIHIPLDALALTQTVTLAKIDVEGAELSALKGLSGLLERDHPVLIIEDNCPEVSDYLAGFGYTSKRFQDSPNIVFTYGA